MGLEKGRTPRPLTELAYSRAQRRKTQNVTPLTSSSWLDMPHEIEGLKRYWLALPIFDLEWAPGFEVHSAELAAWHDLQVHERALTMGCSILMAEIVEELCRCWIDGTRPQSPLAQRVLQAYR